MGRTVTLALLQATHVAAWAFAYGAITYTYYRLNAQMLAFAGDGFESFADATSGALHRWLTGSLAVAALSGAALVAATATVAQPAWWWPLVGLKTAIFVGQLLVLAHVARRMWPRRRLATREAWPDQRRRFFRAAVLTSFLLLCQLVLGALAHVAIYGSP